MLKGGTLVRMGATGLILALAMLIQTTRVTMGSVEGGEAMLAVVARGATLEVLAEGFQWAEGPLWLDGSLLLSDVKANTVYVWSLVDGVEPVLSPSGTAEPGDLIEPGANGLLARDGSLVLMNHGKRCVELVSPRDRSRVTLASHYGGKRLNSPNDGVFDKAGNLYFTDPSYGLKRKGGPANGEEAPDRELDFNGVYRLAFDRETGDPAPEPQLLISDLTRPNGIGISPDGRRLYVGVSDSKAPRWMEYDVLTDGSVARGRVFVDAAPLRMDENGEETRLGNPDGLAVASNGMVFATGPGGVHVFMPDGTRLGAILTGVKTGNCALGGDGYLYVTADSYLARIALASGVAPLS